MLPKPEAGAGAAIPLTVPAFYSIATPNDGDLDHKQVRADWPPVGATLAVDKNRVPLSQARGFGTAACDQLSDFTWPIISPTTPCAEP